MAKKITMSTIAATCDTSIGTVSRALTGKTDINAETKARILRVAEELGYRQNSLTEITHIYRIGVVYCRNHTYFYDTVTQGIFDAQKKLQDNGIKVIPLQTEYLEQNAQLELLSSLKISDYDALIINSAGRKTAEKIDQIIDKGIPVATFNTDAPSSNRIFFCGTDAYSSGRLGGALLARFILNRGKVAVFGNFSGNESWTERFSGFFSVLKEDFPDIELVPILQYYSNDDIAYEAIKKLLTEHPDIKGLFPTNCSCTLGTLRALTELNRKDIIVVGYDVSPFTIECLKKGFCDVTLYQNPYLQGYNSVYLMAQYLLYGTFPEREQTEIPSQILTKYNLETINLHLDTNNISKM